MCTVDTKDATVPAGSGFPRGAIPFLRLLWLMVMNAFFQQLQFLRPGWDDLVEIAIVFLLIYRILLLIRETRAMQMLLGVLLLAGLYLMALIADFSLIRRLMEALLQYGAIAALVVFQPEMRAALARLGQSRLVRLLGSVREARLVDRLVEGVERLRPPGAWGRSWRCSARPD